MAPARATCAHCASRDAAARPSRRLVGQATAATSPAATATLRRADPTPIPDFHLARRGDAVHDAGARHRRPADLGQGGRSRSGDRFVARRARAGGRALPPRSTVERASPGPGCRRCARCGLSERKAEYLRDLARHFASGRLDPAQWPALDDEALIARLVDVKGIGRWTAEMFLMFHELRPDVLPVDDIGLQNAVALHYHDGERMTPKALRAFGERWRPWRSAATWYLWRSLDPISGRILNAPGQAPAVAPAAIPAGSSRPSSSVSVRSVRAASSGSCVTITSAVPAARVELEHQVEHLARGLAVEIAGGLVGEHAARLR